MTELFRLLCSGRPVLLIMARAGIVHHLTRNQPTVHIQSKEIGIIAINIIYTHVSQ